MSVADFPNDSIILEPSSIANSFDNDSGTRVEPRRWKVQLIAIDKNNIVGQSPGDTSFSSGLNVLKNYEIGRYVVRSLDNVCKKVQKKRGGRISRSPILDAVSENCNRSCFQSGMEYRDSHSAFTQALRKLESEQTSYVIDSRGPVSSQEYHQEFLDELDEILSTAAVIGKDCVESENGEVTIDDDLVQISLRMDGRIEMREDDGNEELLLGIHY